MDNSNQKPQKELSKHKALLRKLEKDREKAFPGLGTITYQAYLEGKIQDESLLSACNGIKEIDSRIEQEKTTIESFRMQIEQLRASKKKGGPACPHCGGPVETGAKFCPNCGQLTAPPGYNCPSCGTSLSPGARFCGNCGYQITQESTAPPSYSTTAPTAPPPPAAAMQQPSFQPAPPPPPEAPLTPPPVSPAIDPGEAATEKQERKCPSCSAVIEEDDALFCGECGTRL